MAAISRSLCRSVSSPHWVTTGRTATQTASLFSFPLSVLDGVSDLRYLYEIACTKIALLLCFPLTLCDFQFKVNSRQHLEYHTKTLLLSVCLCFLFFIMCFPLSLHNCMNNMKGLLFFLAAFPFFPSYIDRAVPPLSLTPVYVFSGAWNDLSIYKRAAALSLSLSVIKVSTSACVISLTAIKVGWTRRLGFCTFSYKLHWVESVSEMFIGGGRCSFHGDPGLYIIVAFHTLGFTHTQIMPHLSQLFTSVPISSGKTLVAWVTWYSGMLSHRV